MYFSFCINPSSGGSVPENLFPQILMLVRELAIGPPKDTGSVPENLQLYSQRSVVRGGRGSGTSVCVCVCVWRGGYA
jgi:hypothetical protein